MKNIHFIYFDVGGVLLLDYSGTNKWVEMKRALGVTKELDKLFDLIWKNYLPQICIDHDVDTIIPELKEKVGIKVPDKYSILADFVNRFNTNPSIHPLTKKAKSKYRVGLLTNMFPRMLPLIKKRCLIPTINWDIEVDSSIVGFQKPENGIFEIAEKRSQTDPSKIFFIDNTPENIEAAQKRGWQTFLYNPQDPKNSSLRLSEILGLN